MSQISLYNNNAAFIGLSTANADALDALWLPRHQKAAKFWGVAVASLIGIIAVLHWTSFLFSKTSPSRAVLKVVNRPLRHLNAIKTGEHGPLVGHVVIMALYLGINLTMGLYDRPYESGVFVTFAQRMGWLALCNLCFTVFMSLKNTPLFPLAGWSFDEINVLHRCCGYTTIGCMIIHSVSYLDGLTEINMFAYTMAFPRNHFGAVAGLSMLVILCTATGSIRRRFYESFYVVHVVFVGVIIIAVGFHRNEIAQGELVITLLAASLWFADKFFRWLRWGFFSYGNSCTIEALPHEATKIIMNRSIRAMPGSMCRVYIPSVRAGQRHPFSLVSNNPATFIVRARHGFTKALYDMALANPKTTLRASFEGPYGGFPDLTGYNKVILIAGGSGITFSTSIAMAWSKAMPRTQGTLDLVWSVRDEACISWLDGQLPTFETDPRIHVSLFVSRLKKRNGSDTNGVSTADSESGAEKRGSDTRRAPTSTLSVQSGRPDIARILGHSLAGPGKRDKVLVTACGPKALAMSVRKAVANTTSSESPGIKMHIEEFSF